MAPTTPKRRAIGLALLKAPAPGTLVLAGADALALREVEPVGDGLRVWVPLELEDGAAVTEVLRVAELASLEEGLVPVPPVMPNWAE